jgi:hypothetical protein
MIVNLKIKDANFDVDLISRYNLLFSISNYTISVCVIDPDQHKTLLTESYTFKNGENINKKIQSLNDFFYNHEWLNAGFWKNIFISFQNERFALVPLSIFDVDFAQTMINQQSIKQMEEALYYNKINAIQAVVAFNAPTALTQWFSQKYPSKKITFSHHCSSIIEGLFQSDKSSQKKVALYMNHKTATILVKQGEALLFCNTFICNAPEDLIYYLLQTYEAHLLNKETTSLVLMGNIQNSSIEYQLLYKYIRHIEFIERPSFLRFGYVFDEVPDHFYFDLYSLQLFD